MTDYRNWLKGLLAAALGGAASALTAFTFDPDHFDAAHLKHLELVALCGAIPSVLAYLKNPPQSAPAVSQKVGVS